MATLPSENGRLGLPNETLENIFFAATYPELELQIGTAYSIIHVCRLWYRIGLSSLYYTIQIAPFDDEKWFIVTGQLLSTLQIRPQLGGITRELFISRDIPSSFSYKRHPKEADIHTLIQYIASLLPKISVLEWQLEQSSWLSVASDNLIKVDMECTFGKRATEHDVWTALASISQFPLLRDLHLDDFWENSHLPVSEPTGFGLSFPQLRSLSVEFDGWIADEGAPPSWPRLASWNLPSLETLVLSVNYTNT